MVNMEKKDLKVKKEFQEMMESLEKKYSLDIYNSRAIMVNQEREEILGHKDQLEEEDPKVIKVLLVIKERMVFLGFQELKVNVEILDFLDYLENQESWVLRANGALKVHRAFED